MAEAVDSIAGEPVLLKAAELTVERIIEPPKLSALARNVADSLAAQAPIYQGTGATITDIAAGYMLAAERVTAWAGHRDWPRLRDGDCR